MTTEQKSAQAGNFAIKQINLSYHKDQDRLLLRVGLSDESELVVWITYRMARSVWHLLNKKVAMPSSSIESDTPTEAVEQFKQEAQTAETLNQLDFDTEYQHTQEIPLDSIKLATDIQLVEVNGKPNTLIFNCLGGMNIRLNLNQELVVALCNMLQLSCKDAQWQLSRAKTDTPSITVMDDNASQVLH